ncbi:MAG: TnsA endonuclease N-terminal domain-containing protein [Gammaproteobacteria bacterium]
MSRRRYGFDEKKIERFHKEGRGIGSRATYKPWLTIQDVASRGRSTRIHSAKTGRGHHLLSDIETGLFMLLDWSDTVTDIREQFPLERDATREIARDMGVRHPMDSTSRVDLVMTTDFLIDVRVGQRTQSVARAVKSADDLSRKRTVEKLEIERRYWQHKGVPWHLVTDRDLPEVRIRNLHWLHEMRELDHTNVPYPDYWRDRCERFLADLAGTGDMTIRAFAERMEETGRLQSGEALTMIRHLAANKRIAMDLDRPFSTQNPIGCLRMNVDGVTAKGVA